jgi:two-component system, OmpR family, sensor kinase
MSASPLMRPWRHLSPGGLFWKVFLACWMTALLTGVALLTVATLFPDPLPPAPGADSPPSMLRPLLVGGGLALAISGVLAWSLARPIRLLRQAFGAAAAGRLDTRVSPRLAGRHDEFGALGSDFDRMADQLQTLLLAQRRLLHDVSHELRSPLARLQLATGLLRRSPEGLALALQRIDREVERLDALVDEVLTLARLESGAPLQDVREVDVMGLLASVAEDARFEAGACGLDLQFRAAASDRALMMPANGELLLRAFENVVRNALKYSPPGGCVELTAGPDAGDGGLLISIADRGPGLAESTLASIFDPFVRIAGGPAAPGFGLGLAIARRAIESHGGRIAAAPRVGGGLVLTLKLPAGRPLFNVA